MEVRRESIVVSRTAQISRETKETRRRASRSASTGPERASATTGVGFLDHMLDLLARHGRLDLDVHATGDLQTGGHHTVEDAGSCSGRRSTRRSATAPGSPATATPSCRWTRRARRARSTSRAGRSAASTPTLPPGATGDFDHELAEEFFRAVGNAAQLTLHVTVETGTNAHHMIEAAFKAFARALRDAVAIDPTETGVPSTKGTLTCGPVRGLCTKFAGASPPMAASRSVMCRGHTSLTASLPRTTMRARLPHTTRERNHR